MVLYEGEGFKIIGDGDEVVFKIENEVSEINYGFLLNAVTEYENYCKYKA